MVPAGNGLPGTPVPDFPGGPGPGPGAGGSLGRRRAKKDREEERPARAGGPVPAPLRPASAYNAPAITPTRRRGGKPATAANATCSGLSIDLLAALFRGQMPEQLDFAATANPSMARGGGAGDCA